MLHVCGSTGRGVGGLVGSQRTTPLWHIAIIPFGASMELAYQARSVVAGKEAGMLKQDLSERVPRLLSQATQPTLGTLNDDRSPGRLMFDNS